MKSYLDADLPRYHDEVVGAAENRDRYNKLRELAPLAIGPLGPVVLRYEQIVSLIRDDRLRGPGMELARRSGIPPDSNTWKTMERIFLFLDGEDHQRIRRLVARTFTSRSIERLRPFTRATMKRLVDRVIEDGQADAIKAFCEPMPAPVISTLIGAERPDDIARWANMLLLCMRSDAGLHLAKIEKSQAEIDSYLRILIDERLEEPREDLISTLVHPDQPEDALSSDEVLSVIGGLLIAGTRGITNQLGNVIHAFAGQPRAWQRLRRNPDLIPSAVDEAIRWEPASEGFVRYAMEQIEVEGYIIPAGSLVVLSSISANHDPRVIPGGDRFDIRRSSPEGWGLMTFGGGAHYCLGATLTRLELAEALAELSSRLPELRLEADPIPNPPGAAFSRGYASLPISWN